MPNRGIDVDSVSILGLPLSEREAVVLKSASERLNLRKEDDNQDAITATSRNTWSIAPEHSRLRNEHWKLDQHLRDMHSEMGLQCLLSDVSAELQELVLHGEGASFELPQSGIEKWSGLLTRILQQSCKVSIQFQILKSRADDLEEGLTEKYTPGVAKWFARNVHDGLESAQISCESQAEAFARILSYYNWPFPLDARQYIPRRLTGANNLLVASFNIGVEDNYLQGPGPEDELIEQTKTFIVDFWSTFSYSVKPLLRGEHVQYMPVRSLAGLIGVYSELLEAISCVDVIEKLLKVWQVRAVLPN